MHFYCKSKGTESTLVPRCFAETLEALINVDLKITGLSAEDVARSNKNNKSPYGELCESTLNLLGCFYTL